jgi:hypothetical protein
MPDQYNPICGRRRACTKRLIPNQRVQDAGFTRVEPAEHHDQEGVIGVEQSIAGLVELFSRQPIDTIQRIDNSSQRLEFFTAQRFIT